MSTTSPRLRIPIPEAGDAISDYPALARAAALRIETLFGPPSPSYSAAAVAAAGWRVDYTQIRTWGQAIAFFAVNVTRTGAAIGGNSSGDIGNVALCTLPIAAAGISSFIFAGPIGTSAVGQMSAFTINTAGLIVLVSTAPNSDIGTNASLSCVGIALYNPVI